MKSVFTRGVICIAVMMSSVNARSAFFEAEVTEYGRLESVMGDKLYETDTLSVNGPIDETDLATMLRGITDGKIAVLDLENAHIKYGVIPGEAFASATGLKKIVLPSNLDIIEWNAFKDCSDLEQVEIKSRLRSIREKSFMGCKALKSINLNDGLLHISEYAFQDCSIDSIVFPPSLKNIGDASFSGNSLKKIYAMPGKAPEAINWSVNCVDCEWDIFCGTTPADIPVYVPVGSAESYRNATGWNYLTNYIEIPVDDFPLKIEKTFPYVAEVDTEGTLGDVLSGVEFAIDSLVVKGPIDERDFYSMWTKAYEGKITVIDLKEAKVKDGMIPAGAFTPRNSAEYGFIMPEVRKVILPDGIVGFGDSAFYNCKIEPVNFPRSISVLGTASFRDCENLNIDTLVISEGITSIPDYCFSRTRKISAVKLPQTLEKIGEAAFYGTGISAIALPSSLTSIGDKAFMSCGILGTVSLPSTLTHIGEFAFTYSPLNEISLPENLEYIGKWAFYGSKLKSVVLPDGLISVGDEAFSTTELESIVFPASEIGLGDEVFSHCQHLKSVTLPDWMTVVPKGIFYRCYELENIVFPSTLKEIGADSFSGNAITDLNLPDGLEIIRDYAFSGGKYDAVTLPASVKKIGYSSFSLRRLKFIKSYSPVPPASDDWDLEPWAIYEVPIYVPKGSVELYKAAEFWSSFMSYFEIEDSSALDVTTVSSGNEDVEIFNTAGVRVYCGVLENAVLPSGVYIVKSGGGTNKIYR